MMTRRDFLVTSLITASSMSMPFPLRGAVGNSSPKKIIIIGAGLAGLCCAYELSKSKKDYHIVILEARDRLGGRVHTLSKQFSPGLSAEAGAFWINQNHKMVQHYLEDLGLTTELKEAGGDTVAYHVKGKRFSDAFKLRDGLVNMQPHEVTMGLGGLIGSCLCSHASEMGDCSALDWPSAELKEKYGCLTFHEFIRRNHGTTSKPFRLTPEAAALMEPWFNWWDDLNDVSALMLIRDSMISRRMCDCPRSKLFTLGYGMKQIPIKFAEELAKGNGERSRIEIRDKTPVIGIRRNASSVTATYRLPSGELKDEAGDYLVCAIPFSTLRDLKELPDDLSPGKKRAISGLRYVPVARIYLQYKTPFRALPDGSGMTDRPCGNLLDMTMLQEQANNRGRIIQAYMVGPQAKKVSDMNQEERRKFLQTELETIFTSPEDNIIGNVVESSDSICWHDEEWSRGAYPSFTPKEFTSISLQDISAPEGRIYFAGDHASAYPGWMEGALESGKRVADQIIAFS